MGGQDGQLPTKFLTDQLSLEVALSISLPFDIFWCYNACVITGGEFWWVENFLVANRAKKLIFMIVQGGRSQIHATLVALDTAFMEGFSVCSHHLE